MGAPIHVWEPPLLQSTVGRSVLIPPVVGPDASADTIHQKLIGAAPNDAGRQTVLIDSKQWKPNSSDDPDHPVALVSYNEEDTSDLALSTKARSEKIDFILRGEILPDRRPRHISEADDRLAVSWRLLPIDTEQQSELEGKRSGMPVVVELESAIKRYPDLAFAADRESALQTALVRETLSLVTPTVTRRRVQLEIPYLIPGSKTLRKGNAMALAGRWSEAEKLWREVHQLNPFSSVAVHNLAIAAVAKQDFSEARKLARKAVRMKPSKLHQKTLVWVEQTQRDYHEAFQLPDPPEGWSVTRRSVPSGATSK